MFVLVSINLLSVTDINTITKRYISSFVKSLIVDHWEVIQGKEDIVKELFLSVSNNSSFES